MALGGRRTFQAIEERRGRGAPSAGEDDGLAGGTGDT